MNKSLLAALAGQPNCGKSTLFNSLTGARQHVANYPGVTVEKKTGFFSINDTKVQLVDLPGTYSLTSYSLEERVARTFLLEENPQIIVNVVDASNLKRNLYLTLQLLEMEIPLIVALNMIDVADRRSIKIDIDGLAKELNISITPTMGKKGSGTRELKETLGALPQTAPSSYRIDYGPLETFLDKIEHELNSSPFRLDAYPKRWLAVKLLENDEDAFALLRKKGIQADELIKKINDCREEFTKSAGLTPERHIAFARHRAAAQLCSKYVDMAEATKNTLSDRIDRFVCHKVSGPIILVLILLTLYQLAIVYGGELGTLIWPFWAKVQLWLSDLLPTAGFVEDPPIRALGVWVIKSVAALLNYLPIFFILFSLIAIMEDSGYMPRMAFILDRLFRRFGLHGQSTLPLILGGIYVGGCAIPAVMATKAIPDEKARLATILIAPMMNCLAKVPLYLMMIGAYYSEHSGLAMFFIATVTVLIALPVAKVLSITLLKGKKSAPFIMELPPYHLPTLRGVLSRACERVWLFIKKIITVIVVVAIAIFALINFPGLNQEREKHYASQSKAAIEDFMGKVSNTSFAGEITQDDALKLILFEEELKSAKQGIDDQKKADLVDEKFKTKNELYFSLIRGKGKENKEVQRALKKLSGIRKELRREIKDDVFQGSFMGRAGKALEPLTQYAGFDWKINIALLSAFAAKENSAATLGAIYGLEGDGTTSVEENLRQSGGSFGPLHALALMVFMALYPPCIPTSVMVRLQTQSTGWMIFAIVYQASLGLIFSILIFSGGKLLNLTGWQAMWTFYFCCLVATVIMGLIPSKGLQIKTMQEAQAKN